MAPTGSSMPLRSQKNTLSTQMIAAMLPITAAAQGETNAQGAVIATEPASMPFAIMPGSGLPHALHHVEHPDRGTERRGEGGVRRDDRELHVGRRERRRGVEAEPAEQQDERAEHCHRDVVAGQRPWLAVRAELADPGTDDDGAGKGRNSTGGMHDAGAGEVHVAEAELHRVAELAEPPATPGPRTEQRVVDRPAEKAPADERLPVPALGHRARGDRGRRVHERHHVEEEGHQRRGVLRPLHAGQREAALPQEHPVSRAHERATGGFVEPEHAGKAEPAEHERVPDEEERHEPEAEDGEVRRHDVGCVFGPAEPGLDQREAGLHEDDQHRADHHPQQVETHTDIR